jgi:hypothetical protein
LAICQVRATKDFIGNFSSGATSPCI